MKGKKSALYSVLVFNMLFQIDENNDYDDYDGLRYWLQNVNPICRKATTEAHSLNDRMKGRVECLRVQSPLLLYRRRHLYKAQWVYSTVPLHRFLFRDIRNKANVDAIGEASIHLICFPRRDCVDRLSSVFVLRVETTEARS